MTKQLAQFTTIDVALSVGGLDLRLQEAALRKNPDIVIATPGRFVSIHLNFLTWNAEILKINTIKYMFALCQKILQLLANVVINFILPAIVTGLICLIPSSEACKVNRVEQRAEMMSFDMQNLGDIVN